MGKLQLKTPEDAIRYLGLDRQNLRQPREALRWLCRTGKLRYTKIGRYIMFRQEWLDELVERHEVDPSRRAKARHTEKVATAAVTTSVDGIPVSPRTPRQRLRNIECADRELAET